MSTDFSRRDVLRSSGVLAVGLMAPPWLSAVAKADVVRSARGESVDPDTTIVVIQLSGGNDGLNTVVPYNLAAYYDARKTLAIPREKALDL
ncbi:MAG: twin-arginine translocation pathway signal, partial [Armatimonadetes bacterium]|nr:twin-arginine translocation pathway signal [Armatimonadota bacterium]